MDLYIPPVSATQGRDGYVLLTFIASLETLHAILIFAVVQKDSSFKKQNEQRLVIFTFVPKVPWSYRFPEIKIKSLINVLY